MCEWIVGVLCEVGAQVLLGVDVGQRWDVRERFSMVLSKIDQSTDPSNGTSGWSGASGAGSGFPIYGK